MSDKLITKRSSARVNESLEKTKNSCKQLNKREKSQHLYSFIAWIKYFLDLWDLIFGLVLVPVDLVHLNTPTPHYDHFFSKRLFQSFKISIILWATFIGGRHNNDRFDLIQQIWILLNQIQKKSVKFGFFFFLGFGCFIRINLEIIFRCLDWSTNFWVLVWVKSTLCFIFRVLLLARLISQQVFFSRFDINQRKFKISTHYSKLTVTGESERHRKP